MTPDLAQRLAADASHIAGITSVVVSNRAGTLRGVSGQVDPDRGVALGRFLAARADAAASQDDQRGIGRLLTGSRVQEIRFSGPSGEGVLLISQDELILALLDRGTSIDAVQTSLWNTIHRYEGVSR